MKLNIGANGTKIPGFLSMDVENHTDGGTQPDIIGDFREMAFVQGTVIDEIYMSHLLEHFSYAEAETIVKRLADWLCPNGILWLAVPDFTLLSQAFNAGCDNFYVRGLLYGGVGKEHHAHKSGWSRKLLSEIVQAAGLRVVNDNFEPWVKNAAGDGFDSSCSWLEWPKGKTQRVSINYKCEKIP